MQFFFVQKDLFLSTSYDVKMSDGIELEFNSKGEWVEIDCKNKDPGIRSFVLISLFKSRRVDNCP